jgi:hypothetical protein
MKTDELKVEAGKQWGIWRTFIAKHPLTGSWISFGVGVGVCALAVAILS